MPQHFWVPLKFEMKLSMHKFAAFYEKKILNETEEKAPLHKLIFGTSAH